MRRRHRQHIRELLELLEQEREARHAAEISAATARGELRGIRSLIDPTTIAARSAARQAQPLDMGGIGR